MNNGLEYPSQIAALIGQQPLANEITAEIASAIAEFRPIKNIILHGNGEVEKRTIIDLIAKARGCPSPVYLNGETITHQVLTETFGSLQSDGYGRKAVHSPHGTREEGGFLIEPARATFPLVWIDEAECIPVDLFEILCSAIKCDSSDRRIMLGKETVGRHTTSERVWLVQFTLILATNSYEKLLERAPIAVPHFPIKIQLDR